MTSATDSDAPERVSIVGGHATTPPEIETATDPKTGQTVITNETHFAPRPVHLAFDPATGLVYAGYAPHLALGVDAPDEDQDAIAAQNEYQEFLAFRAAKANGAVVAAPSLEKGASE